MKSSLNRTVDIIGGLVQKCVVINDKIKQNTLNSQNYQEFYNRLDNLQKLLDSKIPQEEGSGEIILVVSGLESVLGAGTVNTSNGTWMNGEYYLVDKTATGTARVWKHKDYESVIKVAGSPIQYWAICPTNTSTSFEIFISNATSGNVPTDSPYDENTLSSLVWNFRGSTAPNVKVVAQVVSADSGGDSENARNFTITISGTPTIDVSGTYFEQNPGTNVYKHESKEYYVYKCSADGTYVVSDNLNCQAMVQGIWYTNTIVENPWDSDLWVGEVGCVMSITLNSDSSSDSENGSENTSYYYKVSGSSMSTVDGNYYETDKLFNGNPVYKHETNEIYLRKTYQNWQITTSATDPAATALFYTDSTDVSSTWHAVAGTPPTVVLVES